MGKVSVTLTVNGTLHSVTAVESEPLLYVLRDRIGLKATRFGCGEGTCGACTVLVNDKAMTTCDLPLTAADGCDITTAEALDTEPAGPLLEAFLNHQAGQCGYCLPGILMQATALLNENPRMSRTEIAATLDFHLCRCGAHKRILDAIQTAGRTMAGDQN